MYLYINSKDLAKVWSGEWEPEGRLGNLHWGNTPGVSPYLSEFTSKPPIHVQTGLLVQNKIKLDITELFLIACCQDQGKNLKGGY